jgi:hypothetical protein
VSRALAAVALVAAAAPALAAQPDPYEALKAMDGHWTATASGGRTRRIDNSCARTGRFFVCEQAVGGQPAALVVFLPRGREEGKLTFKTQTLTAAGDPPGPWRELTIAGDTWTYLEPAHGVAPKRRTVVTHSGPDYMRAEIQVEVKGDAGDDAKDADWRPVSVETFTRAP